MKFNYEAYERLFPRHEAEKVRAEIMKEKEQGNVLEEVEKPAAKQEPVKDIVPEPLTIPDESGVMDDTVDP